MLVLSRLEGQVITIGDNIRVTIVEVRGDKVRVGIDAPRDVQVMRSELLDQTPEGSDNDACQGIRPTGPPSPNDGRGRTGMVCRVVFTNDF